ncbi:hypothetical protein [Chryseobacterium sp. Hurlbut01]|uniref:hypothetical protein n=1 Tax=Chryseobacterium sp. Hurlbut01 TaxID=1681828 RepID=UPI00067BA3FD|nr:hypothetical protein [Chryseobacterium sp. Hurlbut01]KNB60980.1 hypothetical protein AC804_17710 [Chryseobacterium sp. Hurlbut01]
MIDIKLLREKIAETRTEIPEIKKIEFLVTDDELANVMTDHKKEDNLMLVVVVPTYSGFGEEDESGFNSYLQFFLCEKVDLKVFKNQDAYVEVLQRISEVVKTFVIKLFARENCLSLNLERSSLNIDTFARKSQCMGYSIEVDEKSYLNF